MLSHEVIVGIWEVAVIKPLDVGKTYVAHLA